MKRWIIALIAGFFISGCSTLQVQVDSDPEYNFSSLNKFNVVYTKKDDTRDFFRNRFSKSLINYFENKNYVFVQKNEADFYIIFHLDVQKRSEIETNYQEMGMNPRHRYYMDISNLDNNRYAPLFPLENRSSTKTTRTYEYEDGRLVVEILDVKQNIVFWQSIAEDELSDTSSSQKQKSAYIQNLLEKMFKDFPQK